MSTATASTQPNQPLSAVERAIKESLQSSMFLDVKFYVFSRRSFAKDGMIRVDNPRHVLAISSVLKKADYFEKLLSNGFAESGARIPVDSPFPEDKIPYTNDYDYESDSDLDDDDLASDMDMSEDLKPPSRRGKQRITPASSNSRGSDGTSIELAGQCQQIIVNDVAYHTWRALIFYLYFGKVKFLPLRSSGEEERNLEMAKALSDSDSIPPCSPKSMYRLAEKYGIPELQELSFEAIRARLSAQNIVQEVFSRFTSRYDRVRELEIKIFHDHYCEIRDSFADILDRVVQGEFPHAGEVLKTLLDVKNGAVTRSSALPRKDPRHAPAFSVGGASSAGPARAVYAIGSSTSSTSSSVFGPSGGSSTRVRGGLRGSVAPPPYRVTSWVQPETWTPSFGSARAFGDGDDDAF
ncbi:uncharacterized protein LAESUDRAFT_757653 [Laetiporus sulphureus 93-53]|uniref:BTB domain-containing protein n=1 Tax=Laetiporus sulphureus 93-53 TaxID=1314785 RepID=A0A165F5B3_9APHY|nr:uncharacterized protein LAESUDRAFT_757653 [Laetiporus sulphureus 93-53]KZT08419.1 hypothetical protein LAESUDRAFT_757653 [Laetiporus sulphureus 93-53]